jgi:hypothetical protein
VQDYRSTSDVLADFFESSCVFGPGCKASLKDLFDAYKAHCEANNIRKSLGKIQFNEELLCRSGITKSMQGPRERRAWTWNGIGLKAAPQTGNGKGCGTCDFENVCPTDVSNRDAARCADFKPC